MSQPEVLQVDAVLNALVDAVHTVLAGRRAVGPDDELEKITDDSLALLEGLVLVENQLDVSIGDVALQKVWLAVSTKEGATLRDVADALVATLASGSTAT